MNIQNVETGSSAAKCSNVYARSVKYDGQGSKKTRIIFFQSEFIFSLAVAIFKNKIKI